MRPILPRRRSGRRRPAVPRNLTGASEVVPGFDRERRRMVDLLDVPPYAGDELSWPPPPPPPAEPIAAPPSVPSAPKGWRRTAATVAIALAAGGAGGWIANA